MRYLPLLLLMATACQQNTPTAEQPESNTPAIFEPHLISDGFDNRDIAISPDGSELFYTFQTRNKISTIMYAVRKNNKWSEPEIAWFSGKHKDLEASFSPDGNRLYFVSNRPVADTNGKAADYNIWYLEKTAAGWSHPMALDSTINTTKDEFYPSVSRRGNLYFTRDNDSSKEDIFMAVYDQGKFQTPAALPEAINSAGYDFNAFIDPGEEFILFTSYGRADDMGGGDLYLSRKLNDKWQPAIHLDTPINSSAIDYCPYISPDGQYFYFASRREATPPGIELLRTKRELLKWLEAPNHGSDDIYRMPFRVLDSIIKR